MIYRTLLLMRHAKSSWKHPGASDKERPLNKRGLAAAPDMANFLLSHKLVPDLIVSSTAVRAVMTTELLQKQWDHSPKVVFEDSLYLAPPGIYLKRLAEQGDFFETIMLVGHNPGIEELIELLTGRSEFMSTAAVAVLNTQSEWPNLDSKSCSLLDVFRPKEVC